MDRLQVTLTNPKLERWIALDEPRMSAVGDLVFTRADRTATISNVAVTSDTLQVTKGTLAFELPTTGDPVISGNGQSTVDLNRLGRTVKLYTDPNGPEALHGTGTGPLKFRTVGNATEFGGSSRLRVLGTARRTSSSGKSRRSSSRSRASTTTARKHSYSPGRRWNAQVSRSARTGRWPRLPPPVR